MTETAGARIAERSRALADELRRDSSADPDGPADVASAAGDAATTSADEADRPTG
jgi:hypothetical protein